MPTHPPHEPDNADVRSGRYRRAGARTVHRRSRPGRFATVWPCAQDDRPQGTGTLAGWLLNTVIKIVTTYSTAGNRVLLLAASPVVLRAPRRVGPYSGLFEAVWAVIRLGRAVQTGLLGPLQESGPVASGLFDVIIAAVDPRDLTRMRPTSWSGLLTPCGVLVVITHGENTGPRYFDPAGALIAAAQTDGLRYLDHIVALRIPMHADQQDLPVPGVPVDAHADLYVFAVCT